MSLFLSAPQRERVHRHLCRAYPEEGCGVLIGHEREGVRAVQRIFELDNLRGDSRHNRYLISPEQFLGAEQEARAAGLDVLGFYHSHPDHPARPSAFDLEHAWPWYSYVIVSVEKGRVADMRSWRLRDDRAAFEPEPVAPEEPAPGETR